ncbi:putative membrane protein [Synechococcus sp. Minos11]|nr:putative membrane protein [Synechococcus sp. Minos11]
MSVMNPFLLLLYTVIFCVVYGAAYGAALTGKIACINRNSAITALVFAVVLWLLNKPFG